MIDEHKPCIICGGPIYKGHLHYSDFRRKKTCKKECSTESRRLTMVGKKRDKPVTPKKKYIPSKRCHSQQLANQKAWNAEGKRAPIINRYVAAEDEDHPLNVAQAALNLEIDKKYYLPSSPVKIYTPEEIAAIAHEITPINLVKKTEHSVNTILQDFDSTFRPSRKEDYQSLHI